MNIFRNRLFKHPQGALYGTLLGIIALSASKPMFDSGVWDGALVDLVMAFWLIGIMLKTFVSTFRKEPFFIHKCFAWGMVAAANILALLPSHDFPGSLSSAFAFSLLICAFVLYFSGPLMALSCILPTLWCCVFMPYHEEFMLLFSFPLRLSATMLSAGVLKLFSVDVVYAGSSLQLPSLNIAITDACSGIHQLDAFILIAFAAVQMFHRNLLWKVLHFAFVVPSMIMGNSLRIVLTVLLYQILGTVVLEGLYHTVLGYVQIALALTIFLVVGKVFTVFTKEDLPEVKHE